MNAKKLAERFDVMVGALVCGTMVFFFIRSRDHLDPWWFVPVAIVWVAAMAILERWMNKRFPRPEPGKSSDEAKS